MYSMMARRTRHLESSANSTMAGKRLCESVFTPITSLTQSKLEMMLRRTSGHSSLSCAKKSGSKWSMVFSFPTTGERPMMTLASADFTCWFGSLTRSFTYGRMWFMMIDSRDSGGRLWQKSFILPAADARTSASLSRRRLPKAPTSSFLVISGPTDCCNSTSLSLKNTLN